MKSNKMRRDLYFPVGRSEQRQKSGIIETTLPVWIGKPHDGAFEQRQSLPPKLIEWVGAPLML